jgi:hypothetical protein
VPIPEDFVISQFIPWSTALKFWTTEDHISMIRAAFPEDPICNAVDYVFGPDPNKTVHHVAQTVATPNSFSEAPWASPVVPPQRTLDDAVNDSMAKPPVTGNLPPKMSGMLDLSGAVNALSVEDKEQGDTAASNISNDIANKIRKSREMLGS